LDSRTSGSWFNCIYWNICRCYSSLSSWLSLNIG
jgi:hypothetical protein